MAITCCNLTHSSLFLNHHLFKRCHLVSKGSNCSSSSGSVEKVFHRRFQVERRHHYLNVELSSSSSSIFEDVGEEIQEDVSMETLIWRAIKLPIYSVALVPLTVGSAAAYLQTGIFSAKCYFVLLASSVLVITWVNLRYHLVSKGSNCSSSNSSSNSLEKVFHRRFQVERRHHYLNVELSSSSSSSSFEDVGEEIQEDVSMETLIWRAIKLPIYSVALVPLTVGSAAAYLQTGIFSAKCYCVLLASSVLVITWLNLSNDVYDFDTGVDKNKKESVVNLVGSRTGIFVVAYLCLALGFAGLTWAAIEAGNVRSVLFLTCAIICGYIYQCPPFRLSYQGLGEPLCFAAFGPFATTAFYLVQGSASSVANHFPLSGTILSASILVGFTTSLILFCSHFHQVDGDKEVGKLSPLVRLGTERGADVVKVTVLMLYALLIAFGLSKTLPLTCIFVCALTLPVGNLVVRFVQENHRDKNKIFMAKYFCVRLHALFGAALAFGLILARMVNTRLLFG